MIYYETDYLMHHGVKGMKWGRRKPRVLKGQRSKNTVNTSKSKWSTKKKVAVGAGIAVGTTLAAVGGYALYKRARNGRVSSLNPKLSKAVSDGVRRIRVDTVPVDRVEVPRVEVPRVEVPRIKPKTFKYDTFKFDTFMPD